MDKQVIKEIRQFNRFYSKILGLLNSRLTNTKYTLTESRILFEIAAKNRACYANDLAAELNIDRSYLSRILRKFQKEKLITKQKSLNDHRKIFLYLTEHGKQVLDAINQAADKQIIKMFNNLTDDEVNNIKNYMEKIQKKLAK
ncbi:MarR family winged helix-turn-helix transcriptional regulator [Liquorilactobacillus satsumensis]|uniref:Transcriptional regulator n=4 Tax=Liquorilactobacillus satsumensis TaxID=259059 RepID=A0A0R1UZK9_9LACO|nr:MarR family winged helix-turn-helix transcriptional regulator [Liquorilactobacillus satsumensis]KRL96842.1 transcriptional regulator [Liquorilactobacillus satsumensis DSM 16230 = JCM 12392]MCP9313003.1 winged helix-turn-helix transcriptional regulator [Liquorilactobacillus satsumensis]MCP9360159.1 winged helix-turn-helix transcriptional regulator [Liquorilactobacillus satsumensis]